MMDFAGMLAEQKIREALEKGDFQNLPGKGKPLQLEDLSHVPEELRVGYKLLKNAGMIPEEMQLKKEILGLEDLIRCCYDEREMSELRRKLNEKALRYDLLMGKHGTRSQAFLQYEDKIRRQLR